MILINKQIMIWSKQGVLRKWINNIRISTLFVVILLLGISRCVSQSILGVLNTGDTLFFTSDQLASHQDHFFDGVHVYIEDSTHKKVEVSQKDHQHDGYTLSTINGQLRKMGTYSHDKKTGIWVKLYENGRVEYVESYDTDGKLDGPSWYYDNEGRLENMIRYRHGERLE